MPPQNLGELFRNTAGQFPDKKAFLFKQDGRYAGYTFKEFEKKVNAVAFYFIARGLVAGDRIAIFSENRPEWALVDIAAQSIGVITVPIYTTLTSAEIQYILADSGSSVIAVSSKSLFEKIIPIQKSLPLLKFIVGFDSVLSLSQEAVSIPLVLIRDFDVGDRHAVPHQSISSDSTASIIYTSGTTGRPKGVMLTHRNFISNVIFCKDTLKMSETDVHISFLPLCHVFERTAGYYLMIHIGATIGYAENLDTVPQNLIEIRPTFILGVPRFYEKIQERLLETIQKSGTFKKALFLWAKELGTEKRKGAGENRKPGLGFQIAYGLANLLVYKKFKARLGGRVRFCVSGGAPLSKEIAEFFCDLGVMVYEGYGLTETSPVISVNREDKYKFGAVGVPLEGVEVKIADDGEILTKGPCVMKGYYQKPDETRAVLKDGWFYTGDLGALDKEGFLTITGRKKELIVTSGGKKITPRPIEEMIERDPFILRCVLFGEGKKYITALLVLRQEKLSEYAASQKIAASSYQDLLKDSKIHEFIERRIGDLSKDLASYEKIKYFAFLERDFSQSAGELTPTLKVKREAVLSRYRDLLLPYYEKHE